MTMIQLYEAPGDMLTGFEVGGAEHVCVSLQAQASCLMRPVRWGMNGTLIALCLRHFRYQDVKTYHRVTVEFHRCKQHILCFFSRLHSFYCSVWKCFLWWVVTKTGFTLPPKLYSPDLKGSRTTLSACSSSWQRNFPNLFSDTIA